MKIVSDAGPLIGLAKINCLSILKDMAEDICIPPVVYKELLGKVSFESEYIENALKDFIHVVELKIIRSNIKEKLDDLKIAEGERQAIGLASLFSEDVLLLIDDQVGRKVAEKLNIPLTGLIGILLLAKERGILKEISPLIDELKNQGYWISEELALEAKRLAGEEE
jgi:predicted nucleic acid-binding protein